MRQAGHFAARLLKEAGDDPANQIRHAYRLALSREPTSSERDAMLRFLKEEQEASNSREDVVRSSLVQMARVIFNLNEFVYPE